MSTRPTFDRVLLELVADEPGGELGVLTVGGGHAEHAAFGREDGERKSRVGQIPEPLADEGQQARDVGLVDDRSHRLVKRLELARPPCRRLIETRVLDRDGSLRREERDELLVVVREVAALLSR